MGIGKALDVFEDYEGFVAKFEPKKTTDDCYTPAPVYDAVLAWTRAEYGIPEDAPIVRPFRPGGDYENEDYPEGCVVVDNPPFSILSQIVRGFNALGVRYLLFAPSLTCMRLQATKLICGVNVTYDNGAVVNTSFVTNMEPGTEARACGPLFDAVDEANTRNLKEGKPELPRYAYPPEVVMANDLMKLAHAGVDFAVPSAEAVRVSKLDLQGGKDLFGGGLLVSGNVAERLRAEKLKAERLRAEKLRAEKPVTYWQLSPREREVVEMLGRGMGGSCTLPSVPATRKLHVPKDCGQLALALECA